MPNPTSQRGVDTFWLLVAVLAFVALALGVWDVLVERDGGEDWLMQVILPLLLLAYSATMYLRRRKANPGGK